jgi:hypothetical protein
MFMLKVDINGEKVHFLLHTWIDELITAQFLLILIYALI